MTAAGLLARCRTPDASDGKAARYRAPDAERWPVPVFVAGGLKSVSVGWVIRALRPAGVDIASGGESAPGQKDRAALERLFAAVREADDEAD
jgi:phosphoribosylanthranilate isomerase